MFLLQFKLRGSHIEFTILDKIKCLSVYEIMIRAHALDNCGVNKNCKSDTK